MAAKIEGLDRLKRRLARLPAKMKAEVKVSLEQSADELVAMQKRLVPIDQGDLRDSIRKEEGRHELSVTVTAGGPATTRRVRKGADVSYDYALGQEFGTTDMPAQPFFFPAYRALRRRIRGRTSRAVRKAVSAP